MKLGFDKGGCWGTVYCRVQGLAGGILTNDSETSVFGLSFRVKGDTESTVLGLA